MPSFGKSSAANLVTCDGRIQYVLNKAILIFDFSVICGHRDEDDQNAAFDADMSNARWPESPHNRVPAMGADITPWPLDWDDREAFAHMAGIVLGVGLASGVPLIWGGNFKSIKDRPHIEITGWENEKI